jgi:hypothetical protein
MESCPATGLLQPQLVGKILPETQWHVAWGAFQMRKRLLTVYMAKLRQDAEVILKTYGVFIYRQHYIANLFHKNVQKIATP